MSCQNITKAFRFFLYLRTGLPSWSAGKMYPWFHKSPSSSPDKAGPSKTV